MFDIQKLQIHLDLNQFFNKLYEWSKKFWVEVPKWLRTLVIITIATGLSYLVYCKYFEQYQIEALKTEVKALNEKCSSTVFYDAYLLDVNNYAMMVECLEDEIDGLYEQQNVMFDAMIEFVKRTHGNDIMIKELESMKRQMNYTHDANRKVIKHQISIFKENAKRELELRNEINNKINNQINNNTVKK